MYIYIIIYIYYEFPCPILSLYYPREFFVFGSLDTLESYR